MSDFHIRASTPDDAVGIAAVHWTTRRAVFGELLSAEHWETETLGTRTEGWMRILAAGNKALVAEVGDKIVGFAMKNPSGPHLGHPPVRAVELHELYVDPAFHGTNVGHALLENALPPGTPAQLWTFASNPRARKFFQRAGFLPDGVTATDPYTNVLEVRLVR
ncbi:GNAT family N-acetyltransferase [Promicromonospora soli]|uniref:N-acetyltransferase n=1 Tax=Promicromonospora soli TaxID=2035533 RepID=A0A919FZ48_9MICO|nr:GNAT family N-acetyltransferase [Promicromonospora soli]GHH74624.1 N-acetyltransferase [Promicromonospora soli]